MTPDPQTFFVMVVGLTAGTVGVFVVVVVGVVVVVLVGVVVDVPGVFGVFVDPLPVELPPELVVELLPPPVEPLPVFELLDPSVPDLATGVVGLDGDVGTVEPLPPLLPLPLPLLPLPVLLLPLLLLPLPLPLPLPPLPELLLPPLLLDPLDEPLPDCDPGLVDLVEVFFEL